jgi:hypothetical protein
VSDEKPRWKQYGVRFQIEGDEEAFSSCVLDHIVDAQRKLNEYMAESLFSDKPRTPAPPPTPLELLQKEVARRLYDLALELDPDLGDW